MPELRVRRRDIKDYAERLRRDLEHLEDALAMPVTTATTNKPWFGQIHVRAVPASPVLVRGRNITRSSLVLRNVGIVPVYIGDENVLTSNGYPIYPSEILTLDRNTDDIYAVADGGDSTIAFVEE